MQGTFQRKPTQATAHRAQSHGLIDTHTGPIAYFPGDWLVTKDDGETYPVKDSDFRQLYAPVDANARALLEHEAHQP